MEVKRAPILEDHMLSFQVYANRKQERCSFGTFSEFEIMSTSDDTLRDTYLFFFCEKIRIFEGNVEQYQESL